MPPDPPSLGGYHSCPFSVLGLFPAFPSESSVNTQWKQTRIHTASPFHAPSGLSGTVCMMGELSLASKQASTALA